MLLVPGIKYLPTQWARRFHCEQEGGGIDNELIHDMKDEDKYYWEK